MDRPARPAADGFVIGLAAALVLWGLAWELWLAPLRPGGSMLALKVAPLAVLLPGLVAGRLRSLQWLSMLVLLYVCEGAVRGMSDAPGERWLGWIELALALGCFAATLIAVRERRRAAAS